MKTMRYFLSMLMAAVIICGSTYAGDAPWKAGLARVNITPTMPVYQAGYASRNKPFEKVESDLFAKVLALEDATGKKLIIVTSDLIGFRSAFAEPICDKLQKKLGLQRGQILLNSSHTHTGPLVSLEPSPSMNQAPGDVQRTIAYTQELQDKVVKAVEEAVSKMEPARLSWGSGVVNFVMNRREFTPKGVILGVNPRGLVDRGVPVLRVEDEKGTLRAVLFGAACHNTTLGPQNYFISGDYAGYAQAGLEKRYPGVQAMFMIGCGGDANPYPRGSLELSKKHGKELEDEVARVLETKLQPVGGPLKIAFTRAKLPLQEPPPRQEIEETAKKKSGIQTWVAEQMLKVLDRGEKLPTEYAAPITVIQFGQDLTLVGLSGEVVVDYVRDVETAIGPNKLWVAGYCNDVFGYLPSARVLSEGGYETRGLYYGGIGYFSPRAEEVVASTVRKLAEEVGRTIPK
jgi:neutral ceramidase